jgi:hypothetical protein
LDGGGFHPRRVVELPLDSDEEGVAAAFAEILEQVLELCKRKASIRSHVFLNFKNGEQ